jgi:hypothetical protein
MFGTAKRTGLGMEYYVDGIDLSNDAGSFARIAGGMAVVLPQTGINKSAYERAGGGRTGALDAQLWFNKATGQEHLTLSTGTSSDRLVSAIVSPALGGPVACLVCKQLDYSMNRESSAQLTVQTPNLSNSYGLEWTELLTTGTTVAKQTFGAAGNGTGLDYGATIATTAFGLQAYMQVLAFTGTSATVNIQHSDDNAAGDPYATITGGSFTAATAVGTQRIATSRTESIKRWLRINVTGTFSNFIVMVSVAKNLTAVAF